MTTALDVAALTAGHNKVPAVRALDLRVEPGEIVALLGPNGAGKTTTLDTVAGILPALEGEVRVFGQPVRTARHAAQCGLAYVPESRGLFRQLTVDENLRLRARSRRASDDVYARFEVLGQLRQRQAGLLSGGEQQLLAMVCALSLNAKLLLVDEMTMGLAPAVVRALADLVTQVAAEGAAVVFVEQHVHLALEMCDRALVLSHGKCVLQGSGADLLKKIDELSVTYFAGDPSVSG